MFYYLLSLMPGPLIWVLFFGANALLLGIVGYLEEYFLPTHPKEKLLTFLLTVFCIALAGVDLYFIVDARGAMSV